MELLKELTVDNGDKMKAAANQYKKVVKRFKVLLKVDVSKHEWFFRISVNAKDKSEAIELATSIMHKDIQRMKFGQLSVVDRQVELVDKQLVNGVPMRGGTHK